MTKVLIFNTLAEAKKNLEQYLQQNKLVAAEVSAECEARLHVYKNSAGFHKQHQCSDERLTLDEIKMVFYRAGKDHIWTSLLKLYVKIPAKHYAFDGYHDSWEMYSYSEDSGSVCDSIASLVNVAQKQIQEENNSIFGIKTIPLFYTIREIFRYSQEEIRRIKKDVRCQSMSAIEQKRVNQRLHDYKERGLTDAERHEFAIGYAKFLN